MTVSSTTHSTESLSARIEQTRQAHAELDGTSDFDELFGLILKPYWTTPAEWLFVLGYLEAIEFAVQQVATLRTGLLQAARMVGEGE